MLLDNQFNYDAAKSGAIPVGNFAAGTLGTPGQTGIVAGKSGYLYVWVSNETTGWSVFFDNMSVKLRSGPILEESHYYPYGLTMAGISDKALKSSYTQNKILYNGKELQNQEFTDGSGLEEYDYGARMLDPQLGLWHNVDPLANKNSRWSPYNYAYDNPIKFIDPDGMDAQSSDSFDQGIIYSIDGSVLWDNRKENNKKSDSKGKLNKGIVVDNKGNLLSNDGKDKTVYMMKDDKLTKIGELGSHIDVNEIVQNILKDNAGSADKMELETWKRAVQQNGGWDYKDNNTTIFGVAWSYDEGQHKSGNKEERTSFIYGTYSMTSADFGNYNAGYTGTHADIGTYMQKIGAGFAEILKNHTYYKFLSPFTYLSRPFGDARMDYKWNTQGMSDAQKALDKMPATQREFRGSHISNAIQYGNW